ncbi:BTB/POZ protein [Rhizophagus irregularis DAOM 181602=DAOM 197198]|nr:BTB/POZ protein [Rhizophagus irregularis DAOM 181602=DAOM 197198]
MSIQFFSKLSQSYIEILEDNEYYDVTIEVAHIKLSNISPEIFQIILRYLYGGILSLNGQDTLDIFKILIAADELLLHELNRDEIKDLILSYISNMNRAINYYKTHGPSFGYDDLKISYNGWSNDVDPFNYKKCKQTDYEKRIRDTEEFFDIEDYEVFQIMKK